MNQFFCFAIFAACAVLASATEVNKCKSGLPVPVAVDVSNCQRGPCELPKGSTVYMNLTIDAPIDLDSIEPKIIAHALGMDVDYPLNEKEGCNELIGAECPLEEGQRVLYGTSIDIMSFYPNINFGIEFTVSTFDEDGEKLPFTCFQIDGKVVN